ncbi:ferritin, middle subunit-like [Rhinoraja longicauda]
MSSRMSGQKVVLSTASNTLPPLLHPPLEPSHTLGHVAPPGTKEDHLRNIDNRALRARPAAGAPPRHLILKKPAKSEWGSGLEATQDALELQKNVNKSLLDLHQLATDKEDPQLCNFLESNFLNINVEFMKTLGDHITSLMGLSAGQTGGMGEYLFDQHSLE